MVEWRCGSTGVCCRSCSSSQCRGIPSLRFSLHLFYFYLCSSYSLASVLFLPSWFFLFFSFLFLSSSFPLPCSPLFSFFSFLPLFSVLFSPQSPLSNRPLFPSLYSLSVLFSCLLYSLFSFCIMRFLLLKPQNILFYSLLFFRSLWFSKSPCPLYFFNITSVRPLSPLLSLYFRPPLCSSLLSILPPCFFFFSPPH